MSSLKFIDKLEISHEISLYKLIKIIEDSKNDEYLFAAANRVREKFAKKDVHLKALIEISNICANTCFYCGLRNENYSIKRYKMSNEEIISYAKEAAVCGYKTIVLQSGESAAFKDDELCKIISEIKKFGVQITLSLGEKTRKQYAAYKNAGANRYLLRIETTDKTLYEKFHPGMSLENRIKCLFNLKELGYETGSGLLVGLPWSNAEILAKDLLFLKKMDFDMLGIGPFIPAPNTPLQNCKGANENLALKINALARLLLPKINIPATTAIESIDPENGRKKALQSGANVIMPSITNAKYHELYKLYPNKFKINATPLKIYINFKKMLRQIGSDVSPENGDSVRFSQRKVNANSKFS